MDVLAQARAYLSAGLSIFPLKVGKVPVVQWREFRTRLATDNEAVRWWGCKEPLGIALVCGRFSAGGIEVLDFDNQCETIFPDWADIVKQHGLYDSLTIHRTPRGGRHVVFRTEEPGPNQELAVDPSQPPHERVLIETRGEGGYIVLPGSPHRIHPAGVGGWQHTEGPKLIELAKMPPMTREQRDLLIEVSDSYDRRPRATTVPVQVPKQSGESVESVESELAVSTIVETVIVECVEDDGWRVQIVEDVSPGDDYDARGPEWLEILGPHGWTIESIRGDEIRWKRPGKESPGCSATTGVCKSSSSGRDLLRIFSSSAHPFESGKAYGKFRAYAMLNHAGNLSAAARELKAKGYGTDLTPTFGGVPPGNPPTDPTIANGCVEEDLVPIELSAKELLIANQVRQAIGEDPRLFLRGGRLVRPVTMPIVAAKDDEPVGEDPSLDRLCQLRHADVAYVRERIASRCFLFVQDKEGKQTQKHVPTWLPGAILSAPDGIHSIDGVLQSPTLDFDGRLINEFGYDKPTRLYLAKPIRGLCVKDSPTRDDAIAAAKVLDLPLSDFPFATDTDRSRWIAMLLTCCVRHWFGPVPMGLITANEAGSGKTKLAKVMSLIAHGSRQPITSSWPTGRHAEADNELRKSLASLLEEGVSLFLYDNLPRGMRFSNGVLDAFLTSSSFYDRRLGTNDGSKVGGENRILLLATGNRIVASGDTAERVLTVQLECDSPTPRLRPSKMFRFPDVEAHIREHRAKYLGAVLTIWRAWQRAGSPKVGGVSWGSFEGWVDRIASLFRWLDYDCWPDPIAGRGKDAVESDPEQQAIATLMTHWHELFGREALTVPRILERLNAGPTSLCSDVAENVRGALQALGVGDRWPPSTRKLSEVLQGQSRRSHAHTPEVDPDDVFSDGSKGILYRFNAEYNKNRKSWYFSVDMRNL